MIEQSDPYDVVGEMNKDPRTRLELAVAEVQLRLEQLLEDAVDNVSPIDIDSFAATLDVDRDRVLRVLDGTDPLRLESFVRYTTLLGFTAHIALEPSDDVAQAVAPVVDHFTQVGADSEGTSSIMWQRAAMSLDVEPLSDLRYEHTTIGGLSFVDATRTKMRSISQGETYNLTEPRPRHKAAGHVRG